MIEILAAMIIACSNLTHGDSNFDARRKSECIKRVSECGVKTSQDYGVPMKRAEMALKCANEIYLVK